MGSKRGKDLCDYVKLQTSGEEITKLVVEKNRAYGDAVTKVNAILAELYPDGVEPDRFSDMLLLVRVLDKLCRIAAGDPDAFGESPWRDIAGYGIIGMAKDGDKEDG